MEFYNFSDDSNVSTVFEKLAQKAILVHLNNVYALVSLASDSGINSLDEVKLRKRGKCYGSMVSQISQFIRESTLDATTKHSLTLLGESGVLENSFLRLPWNETLQDGLIMNRTHQGLILSEPIRSFCSCLESILQEKSSDVLLPRLICSSANISGDENGSITSRNEAIEFGIFRKIELFVEFNFDQKSTVKGSFPIFSFNNMTFEVERDGPNREIIEEKLIDAGLRKLG